MFFPSVFVFEFLLGSFIDFMLIGSAVDFTFIDLVLKPLDVSTVIVILLDFVIVVFFDFPFEAVDLVITSLLVGGLILFSLWRLSPGKIMLLNYFSIFS